MQWASSTVMKLTLICRNLVWKSSEAKRSGEIYSSLVCPKMQFSRVVTISGRVMPEYIAAATFAKVLHLVFHQSYQRRYHQAHTIHGKCRHLKGDALAATRRHQAESIFALTYTLDNFLLNATEVGITPIFLEYGLIVGQFSLFGLMSSICNCTWLRLNTLSSMV